MTRRFNTVKTGHTMSCGCSKFNNPKVIEDLTGKNFGRLTVVERDFERDKNSKTKCNAHWLCKCDCGNPILSSVTGYQLKTGHTQSCGCYASEQISKRNKKYSTKINDTVEKDDCPIYFSTLNHVFILLSFDMYVLHLPLTICIISLLILYVKIYYCKIYYFLILYLQNIFGGKK